MLKKYPYLYEIPIFFLLLFGANRFLLPNLPGFIGVDPHPYWIGILLFGFRYGVPAGLLSGLVSAGLYLYSAWTYLERYLFEDATFYLLPSFFILVGVLVGVGVRRYRATMDRLSKEKVELQKTEKALREEIKTIKEINTGLEKKVVTRMATMVTVYEGARRLESADLEELYPSILEFVTKTLGADKTSLYLKTNGGFLLKKNIGWQDYEKRPETIAMNEGILGMAGASGKIVSVRDFLTSEPGKDQPAVLGDALMAGPLRNGETGDIIGVLGVQEMPFLNFNSASINLFSFLLQWASRSIGRAHYIQDLRGQEIVDPEYHIYSYRYFLSRAGQELARSKTYYLPLSLGLVKIEGSAPVLLAASQVIRHTCREMDVVARFDDPQIPFAFLLITASPAQAEETRLKMLENFKKLNLDGVTLKIGFSNFSPQTKDLESFMDEARQKL